MATITCAWGTMMTHVHHQIDVDSIYYYHEGHLDLHFHLHHFLLGQKWFLWLFKEGHMIQIDIPSFMMASGISIF